MVINEVIDLLKNVTSIGNKRQITSGDNKLLLPQEKMFNTAIGNLDTVATISGAIDI